MSHDEISFPLRVLSLLEDKNKHIWTRLQVEPITDSPAVRSQRSLLHCLWPELSAKATGIWPYGGFWNGGSPKTIGFNTKMVQFRMIWGEPYLLTISDLNQQSSNDPLGPKSLVPAPTPPPLSCQNVELLDLRNPLPLDVAEQTSIGFSIRGCVDIHGFSCCSNSSNLTLLPQVCAAEQSRGWLPSTEANPWKGLSSSVRESKHEKAHCRHRQEHRKYDKWINGCAWKSGYAHMNCILIGKMCIPWFSDPLNSYCIS
jgi:hypothetical protein